MNRIFSGIQPSGEIILAIVSDTNWVRLMISMNVHSVVIIMPSPRMRSGFITTEILNSHGSRGAD
jgi:hypothetical protein